MAGANESNRPVWLLGFLLSILCCGPAAAQVTAYAPGQGSPNEIVLSVPVTASINTRCGFATPPSGAYDQPNFDQTGLSRDFEFALDCTVPLRIGVVSSNGGLLAAGGPAPAGYTTLAPYDVTLNIVGDNATSVSATCAASALTSGSTCSDLLGPASETVGLRLNDTASASTAGSYLRVSAPPYAGGDILVAATYADTLVVTLSASP